MCANLSSKEAIANGLTLPSSFGISIIRDGLGLYVPRRILLSKSDRFSSRFLPYSVFVTPSIPTAFLPSSSWKSSLNIALSIICPRLLNTIVASPVERSPIRASFVNHVCPPKLCAVIVSLLTFMSSAGPLLHDRYSLHHYYARLRHPCAILLP